MTGTSSNIGAARERSEPLPRYYIALSDSIIGELAVGANTFADRQRRACAVAGIVVLCLIAAVMVPAVPNRAEPALEPAPFMEVTGETDAAMAGRSIAFLDINDDGVGDLAVGAPGDDSAGANSGKVMIYLGPGVSGNPDVEITGSAGERLGFSLARAGDVNSDGIDDLIMGAPGSDSAGIDAGAAYIVFGHTNVASLPSAAADADVIVLGENDREQFGYSICSAGDADEDGVDDVYVGAPFANEGAVYLLYGDSSMDSTIDKTFNGDTVGDQFGFSVSSGLNLDGTSQPDLVVGAPASSSAKGAVSVILNPAKTIPKVVVLTGATIGDRFGTSTAVLDYNGDIYGDVAVGAPNVGGAGAVYLFYGSSISGRFDKGIDVTFSEGLAGDMFGVSLSAGEPRTDGVSDLMVGAPGNDTAGTDSGCAYVFYGNSTADAIADVFLEGFETEARFGFSVATGPEGSADYDGDSAADFAVGAPYDGTATQGAAYLYLGFRVVLPANPIVYGYVLDSVTGLGISDALVTMVSPAYTETVRTTANGSYGIAAEISLPPGTYWINASVDGYFTGSQQHDLAYETCTNVSFSMLRLPVLDGVISDGNDTGPLEDALVEVYDDTDALLDSLTTDATGAYSFVLEYVGDITIVISKDYYFDIEDPLTIATNDEVTTDYTLDHYPILVVTAENTDLDPIAGVDVSVSIGGVVLATGETDASGEATMMVPGEGSAYVNSTMIGYVPDSSIVVLAANVMTYLDIEMDRQPSIFGTVKDSLFEAPISGAVVDMFESGGSEIVDTATTDSFGSYTLDAVEEGTYDLRVTATGFLREYELGVCVVADEATMVDFWLVTDSIPPTSEISDPQPGTLVTSTEVFVFANATDPNGNEIASVALWYSHEGKPYQRWAIDRECPYMFVFDATEAFGDGVYEFYTIATDCAGNAQVAPASNDTWIVISSGVPVSAVDELDPYQGSATFTVTATGSDPFGVQYIELWFSYEGGAYEMYGSDSVMPYSWDFTAVDGDGEYSFYSILVNGLDQTELPPDEADATTLLDTTAPAVAITAPADASEIASGSVDLEASASDDGAGLDYVTYSVDGGAAVAVEVTDGAATYDLSVTLDLADGEHTLTVTAIDMLGWEASDEVTVLVDTEAPELAIVHPADGSAVNTPDVEVSWTVTDDGTGVALTEIRFGSGTWETVVGTTTLFEGLDDDVYTVEIRATDGAGNTATASSTFEVDTIAPTVYITTPQEGASLTTSTVLVKWEQSDIGSGLDVVVVRIDGGEWLTALTNSTTFSSVPEGLHTVDVMATDLAGNSDTDSVTFSVDGSSPVIDIVSPTDGELLPVDSVVAEWEVTDGGSGVSTVEYKLDASAWVPTTAAGTATLSDLTEGAHTFSVRAEDYVGNTATASVSFSIDTLPPTVDITSPAEGAVISSSDVTVEYDISGTGSAVDSVEISLDGGAWEAAGMNSELLQSLDEGDHAVSVRATDEAGHQATDSVSFTVDLGAPVVTITSPADGALFNTDAVTVTWTVSDAEATVEVSLDGGAWEAASGGSETFSGLDDGSHTVDVRATDEGGNEGGDSVTFAVDTTPPSVTITAPAEGAIIASSSVSVTWTAADAYSTEYSVDGGAWLAVSGTSVTLSSLSDGEHTVTVRVSDEAGNEAEDTVGFAVDTADPSVSITSPEDGAVIDSSSVALAWTATDVDTTEYSVDGGSWLAVTGTSVTVSSLADGEHTISVRVTDVAGNTAMDSVAVTVDTAAPTVVITAPASDASVADTTVAVVFSADDGTGSGVSAIEVSLDGGAWSAADSGTGHTFTGLAAGEHTVEVRATDMAGNTGSDSVTFTVVLDDVDPTVSITSPADAADVGTSSVTVTWEASDGTGSGVETTEVQLDGGAWQTATGTSYTLSSLTDGSHTVTVRVTDGAGNTASDSVTFTVDTVDPTLTITSPEDGWETEDTSVTVEWTCTDAGSGLDRIEVSIDGGSFLSVGAATEHAFDGLAAGEHTVDVRAYDDAGNMAESSVSFTVTEGGGISALTIAIVLLVVVAAVVAVAMLLKRRKKESSPPIVE